MSNLTFRQTRTLNAVCLTGMIVVVFLFASQPLLMSSFAIQGSSSGHYRINAHLKPKHVVGDGIVTVTGRVTNNPGPGFSVAIGITNPDGVMVNAMSVPLNGEGQFSQQFVSGGTPNWIAGTYTVKIIFAACISCTIVDKILHFKYSP